MTDTVALVTGATRGIGRQVAADLAGRGITVLVSGRDAAAARRTAAELAARGDVRALDLDLDVTDPRAVTTVPDVVRGAAGHLDVLVNNAAAFVGWTEVASAADLDAAHRVVETNLFGPWRLTQVLLPLLCESPHPRVVNVSSGGGSHGDEQFGPPGAEEMGARPVEEGAASVVAAAMLPDGGPSGAFLRDGRAIPW